MAETHRILVVADLTPATPRLLDLVRARTTQGGEVTLLIPHVGHPDHPDWTTQQATDLLEQHTEATVRCRECATDALAAVEGAVEQQDFDEIIVSTLPEHRAHWFKQDLPSRIRHLGIPVEEVRGVEAEHEQPPTLGGALPA